MLNPIERVLYLSGKLKTSDIRMKGQLNNFTYHMKGSLSSGVGDIYPAYEGPYIVIPKVYEDQVLDTDFKIMKDDVLVKEIPYDEVSNPAGGETFIIGGV